MFTDRLCFLRRSIYKTLTFMAQTAWLAINFMISVDFVGRIPWGPVILETKRRVPGIKAPGNKVPGNKVPGNKVPGNKAPRYFLRLNYLIISVHQLGRRLKLAYFSLVFYAK